MNSKVNGVMYTAGVKGNPLYTENVGDIIISGINNVIEGALVSGNDIFIRGDNTTINYPDNSLDDIISKYYDVSVIRFDFKEAAKRVVERFAGTQTKMAVIQYADSANKNSFKLYDLSSTDGVDNLKNEIDSIEISKTELRNMGDGLRRAYHLLNSQPASDASKYIISLSCSDPSKWTASNATSKPYKSDDGKADYLFGDGTYDADGKALEYAKSIGRIIASSSIEPVFITYSDDLDVIGQG